MAFTQSNLDALNNAISSGELTIRQGDRWVTYRDIGDLIKARDLVKQELAAAASPTPRAYPRYQQADFSDD